MISSVIILGLVGWIIALLLIYQNVKAEQSRGYKAIDFSAVKDGRVGKLFKSGIFEGIPVISKKNMRKISEYLHSDEVPESFKDDLKVFTDLNLKVMEGDLSTICKKLNCPAVIAKESKEKFEIQGIDCINIKDLDCIGRSNLVRGEKIKVKYVDYGYDSAQGFLEDGTFVEIKGNIPKNKPISLNCVVEAIMESQFKRKIWAKVLEDD